MVEPFPRRRLILLALCLLAGNVLAWLWALSAFGAASALLGTAALAYGFGLRHAVDADHIAAIDNVTRKLRGDGARPTTVGLFFALGHSAVVLLATIGIALAATTFQDRMERLQLIGGTIGTLISATFLFTIALANAAILFGTWRSLRGRDPDATLPTPQAINGALTRLLRPALRLIRHPWQMFPLGFLFGLGFDTASEIALLGLSAAEAARGLPLWSILALPALFAAGMSAVDTADGVLMLYAYDWAFIRPQRKLYYNLAITAASVAVALLVGGLELLGLLVDRLGLDGPAANIITAANDRFGLIGYAIIALFAALWAGAVLLARRRDAPHRA